MRSLALAFLDGVAFSAAASLLFFVINKIDTRKDPSLRLKPLHFINRSFVIPIFTGSYMFFQWLLLWNPSAQLSITDATFMSGIGTIAALAFFIYKTVAGAFFATTSVSVECERIDDNHIVVKAKIERGDNWLVEIKETDFALHPPERPPMEDEWMRLPFPKRYDEILRLAPKENTHSQIRVKWPVSTETYVTARVVSFAISWPWASRSYARAFVAPAHAPFRSERASEIMTDLLATLRDATYPPSPRDPLEDNQLSANRLATEGEQAVKIES